MVIPSIPPQAVPRIVFQGAELLTTAMHMFVYASVGTVVLAIAADREALRRPLHNPRR